MRSAEHILKKKFISFKEAYILADKGLLSSLEIKEIQLKKDYLSSSEDNLNNNNEEGVLVEGKKKKKMDLISL